VVHGPLSAMVLVELAARCLKQGERLRRFTYRATSSMYVGKEIVYRSEEAGGTGELKLWARQENKQGMTATATVCRP
jgi:hydroxyacyl-ACP dehydratase HTD2-like protein with hotdog domain